MQRVIVYIDGFNLYFGMTDSWQDTKWLDNYKLSQSLLKPNQDLQGVKYFTSRVSNNHGKQKRQSTFLEAQIEQGCKIYYGKYQAGTEDCRRCGHTWTKPREKMTDVNIATQLLVDAFEDKFDIALLISGDSDLVPPINAVTSLFKQKQVIIAFPPNRQNVEMKKAAGASFILGRKKLLDNQLPSVIRKKDGYILRKPVEWN